MQAGFHAHHWLENLVVCLDFAIDWAMAHKKYLVLTFLDLVKAFDRVPVALLFRVLLEYGVDVNVVEVLWHLHTDIVG